MKARPRVLMAIANLPHGNTGKGGHYYSTRVIYTELKKHIDVRLVVIGYELPEALRDIDGIVLIRTRGAVLWDGAIALRRALRDFEANVVHCMDANSLLFARLATLFTKTPVMWTKCGGRTLRRYTPRGAPNIVFHADDYNHYRELGFQTLLIPNRISLGLPGGGVRPGSPADGAVIRMVRISRICAKYADGLRKAIRLAQAVNAAGMRCTLDIIGYLEDSGVHDELRAMGGQETRFRTSDDWTAHASDRLGNYDLAVATGRTAMEAVACGLPTFITPSISDAPVLMDRTNFETAFKANISERSACAGTMDQAVAEVRRLMEQEKDLAAYESWAKEVYESHLDVGLAMERYLDAYAGVLNVPYQAKIADLLVQSIWYVSSVVLYWRAGLSLSGKAA